MKKYAYDNYDEIDRLIYLMAEDRQTKIPDEDKREATRQILIGIIKYYGLEGGVYVSA